METITAAGNLNGKTGSFTGTGEPVAPTAAGVYLGLDTSTGGAVEICAGSVQYFIFAIPKTSTPTYDFRGRMIYSTADSSFAWHVRVSGTAKYDIERNNIICWWLNGFVKRSEVEVQREAIDQCARCHKSARACRIRPNPNLD